jgi:hypothetical protein
VQESWDVVGLLIGGLIALIIALGRGWLLTPDHVQQWRSRYEAMKDDRDYWRREARHEQRQAREAVDLQSQKLEDTDAS